MRWSLCLIALASFSLALADSTNSIDDAVRYARLRGEIFASTSPSKTKQALEEAVKLYGLDGDLWWRLGQARLRSREYDAAIDAYRNAMRYGADGSKFKASALYDIACAFALKGDKQQAYQWLQKSMDAGFRDLQHVRDDTDLNSLHGDRRWEVLAATRDTKKMSRNEAWRYDLWLLDREVSRIHINPYTRYSRAEQDKWVKQLRDAIPRMTDHQIQVAFMKYMRRVNDGHTGIRPPRDPGNPSLPMQLFWFEEGIVVVAADPAIKDLVGCRIVNVAGRPIEEVTAKIDEISSQDNPQTLRARTARYLVIPAMLHGLGLMPDKDEVELGVVDSSGLERTVTVKAALNPKPDGWIAARDTSVDASPLTLKHRDKPYWFQPLPDQKAVYMQYNMVQDDPKEDTQKFADRLFGYIDKNDVDTLIVDVRWNGGGNSFLNLPIVNGIIGCKKIQAPGHLFVITGRDTFSAAQNFTTDLDRACRPLFVGEPTGSSPNFIGETVRFVLPYSKMEGSISDLYWQRSWPMDARIWIPPDIPALPRFEFFKADRDPAMEAIATYRKG